MAKDTHASGTAVWGSEKLSNKYLTAENRRQIHAVSWAQVSLGHVPILPEEKVTNICWRSRQYTKERATVKENTGYN